MDYLKSLSIAITLLLTSASHNVFATPCDDLAAPELFDLRYPDSGFDIALDSRNRRVRLGEKIFSLTRREFGLLDLLLSRNSSGTTEDEMSKIIWRGYPPSDLHRAVLDLTVNLNAKLQDADSILPRIQVRGHRVYFAPRAKFPETAETFPDVSEDIALYQNDTQNLVRWKGVVFSVSLTQLNLLRLALENGSRGVPIRDLMALFPDYRDPDNVRTAAERVIRMLREAFRASGDTEFSLLKYRDGSVVWLNEGEPEIGDFTLGVPQANYNIFLHPTRPFALINGSIQGFSPTEDRILRVVLEVAPFRITFDDIAAKVWPQGRPENYKATVRGVIQKIKGKIMTHDREFDRIHYSQSQAFWQLTNVPWQSEVVPNLTEFIEHYADSGYNIALHPTALFVAVHGQIIHLTYSEMVLIRSVLRVAPKSLSFSDLTKEIWSGRRTEDSRALIIPMIETINRKIRAFDVEFNRLQYVGSQVIWRASD